MEISALRRASADSSRALLASISTSDVRWLQRQLRGMTVKQWMQWRRDRAVAIADFIRLFPDRVGRRRVQGDELPMLKLAAWQICQESAALFLHLGRHLRAGRQLRTNEIAAVLALEIAVVQHVPALWPADIGMPFRR